jgi:hypothetical protein
MGLLDEQVPYPGPDGVTLPDVTAAELHAIADAVESLTAIRGTVPAIDVGGLRVTLRRKSNQHDGDWYTITAITRAEVGR